MSSGHSGAKSGKDARKGASFLHRTDLTITGVLLAVCGALWYETTRWESISNQLSENIPPTFFPRIGVAGIMLMSLFLPFENYFKKKQGSDLDKERSDRVLIAPILGTATARTP